MHSNRPALRAGLAALGLLALFAGSPAFSAEMIPANTGGDITITPISHATLELGWNGVTILADPGLTSENAQPLIDQLKALPAPQVILITHEHGDHFNADVLSAIAGTATLIVPQSVADKLPDALKGQATVLANGASTEVSGVTIEAVPMYNITPDRLKYHPQGKGNGYVVTLGGKRLYVAGDTEDTPEMRALQNIDAAFVPMNLPYTMSVENAADAVEAFKPKVVYPYHYGDSDVNQFKALVGDASDVRLLTWYPSS